MLLAILTLITSAESTRADWPREELKIRVCASLHAYIKAIETEPCTHGRFKFVERESQVTDFRWRQGARRCVGTIYDDAGDIHVDFCQP